MSQIVAATFENGVFRPHEELVLAPGTTVRLIVDRLDDIQLPAQRACDELDDLCAELPIDSGGARLTRDQLHGEREKSLITEDFDRLADELADGIAKERGPEARPLSEYAVSREGLYEGHL